MQVSAGIHILVSRVLGVSFVIKLTCELNEKHARK
jgi:hypothetical protein